MGNSQHKDPQQLQSGHEFRDVSIPVPWGHVSGVWWGPANVQPIVALHGWQDNAGSFSKLVPLLSKDLSFLCIDLPGHGHSSHLRPGHFYHVYSDGIILLRRIIKFYNWEKVKLLGHSMGGSISFFYAASYPDEVEFLVSLDVVVPNVRELMETASMTGLYIDKFLQYEKTSIENTVCYEYSKMVDMMQEGYHGSLTRESAEILLKRGIRPALISEKHCFSRDPRLKVSMIMMFSMDIIITYAARIKCAYLNIRAVSGLDIGGIENYHKMLAVIKQGAKKFEYREVDGTHYVHLNNPERVASIINEFINTL